MSEHDIKLGIDALYIDLHQEGLQVKVNKSYIKTTFSKHWMKNILIYSKIKRSEAWTSLRQCITYVVSNEGVHYLWLVTDAFSRKIVGYHLITKWRRLMFLSAQYVDPK